MRFRWFVCGCNCAYCVHIVIHVSTISIFHCTQQFTNNSKSCYYTGRVSFSYWCVIKLYLNGAVHIPSIFSNSWWVVSIVLGISIVWQCTMRTNFGNTADALYSNNVAATCWYRFGFWNRCFIGHGMHIKFCTIEISKSIEHVSQIE